MNADGYALLVVDMQNGFCHPDGSFPRIGRGLEGVMEAVGNAAIAVGQARRAGVPVIITRHVYRHGRADEGAALVRNRPELAGVAGEFPHPAKGRPGWDGRSDGGMLGSWPS